jgi:signal transduction histidine kinase
VPEPTTEIWWLIIVGTTALLMLSSIFIVTVYFNQKRFIASQKEKLKILEEGKQQLKESHDKLRQLAAHLQSVREEERTHIAREIHDELGQMLTALKMDVALLQRKVKNVNPNLNEAVNDMQAMSGLIDDTIKSVRKIATELRPEILDELGIKDAIEWETQIFRNRTGIECEFITNLNEQNLERDQATALFRILQEAFTNIARHASATEVIVTLNHEDNELIMEITDNGKGITDAETQGEKSLGILGMRERTMLLGGEFKIQGISGKGTKVIVRIPIDNLEDLNFEKT